MGIQKISVTLEKREKGKEMLITIYNIQMWSENGNKNA